jgi:hypothetical protein
VQSAIFMGLRQELVFLLMSNGDRESPLCLTAHVHDNLLLLVKLLK